ncbi:MAG: hypothetical protein ABEK04_05685 [Candidatus Nanohalobium sp.]
MMNRKDWDNNYDYRNVECKRCGNQWYSEKFDEEGTLPERCPRCYQDEIRKIPEPPTKVDEIKEEFEEKKEEIPEKVAEEKHQLTLWKEQNRILISMIYTGIILMALVAGLAYLLFQ